MYTSHSPPYARNIVTKPEGITFNMDSGQIPIKVIIKEDTFEDPLTFAAGSKAVTSIEFLLQDMYTNIVTDSKNKIKSFQKNGLVLVVQTKYMQGIASTIKSGYGRGTTDIDVKSGNTTLEFHESQHSKESFDYIHKYQVPDVNVKAGMTVETAQAALDAFGKKMADYVAKLEAYHIAEVDCSGTKASFCK